MEDISNFKCPFLDKLEMWTKADNFRKEYWPENTLPIDMEQIIEMKMGIFIEPIPDLRREHDIDAFLKRDYSGVVVDLESFMEDRFQNRFRFSLAHEIGHLILHRNLFEKYPIRSIEEWGLFITEIPDDQYRYIEYQANEFAGRLLVPGNVLMKEVENCVDLIKDPELIEFLKKSPEAIFPSISPMISRVFGVSDEVIQLRFTREEIGPDCVHISKSGKVILVRENQSDRR